jgi:hypothetical protein
LKVFSGMRGKGDETASHPRQAPRNKTIPQSDSRWIHSDSSLRENNPLPNFIDVTHFVAQSSNLTQEGEREMNKTKTLLAGALMAVFLASIGGCVYYVRGPYPLVSVRGAYDRDCRYYRNC